MDRFYSRLSFLCIFVLLVSSTASLVNAGTWLIHDDGTDEGYDCIYSSTSRRYGAVKFVLPEGCEKAKLLTVSAFKTDMEISTDPGELVVHVLDSDFGTELASFDFILATPGGFFRSISPPGDIVVPKEFYIVLEGDPEACIGLDSSSSGNSYTKDNGEWEKMTRELMVRAEIECIYEPVGGELLPGGTIINILPYILSISLLTLSYPILAKKYRN